METIAVYWEQKVRTYGFQVQEKLRLWQVDIDRSQLSVWGEGLCRLAEAGPSFQWVCAQPCGVGRLGLWLICGDLWQESLKRFFQGQIRLGMDFVVKIRYPVDTVYFHGPHFGDRYGIADFTLKAVAMHRIPLLGMICSVSAISLVLPDQWGVKTKAILSQVFEIPDNKESRKLHKTH